MFRILGEVDDGHEIRASLCALAVVPAAELPARAILRAIQAILRSALEASF